MDTIAGFKSYFQYWTATGAVLQNANALQSGVTFQQVNSTVTAVYKAVIAATPSAFASNNQRKVTQTSTGVYCLVYTSGNRIWFTRYNESGPGTPEFEVSRNCLGDLHRYPSIVSVGEVVNVVWQSTEAMLGSYICRIHLRKYNVNSDTWGSDEEVTSFWVNSPDYVATPVITAFNLGFNGIDDQKAVAWTDPSGIKIQQYNLGWSTVGSVLGTGPYCCHPSIEGWQGSYSLVWEDTYQSTIRYIVASYSQSQWYYYYPSQVSLTGWVKNAYPCLTIARSPSFVPLATVVWQSYDNIVEGGTNVHVRQLNGLLSSDWGNITSFSLGGWDPFSPSVGTFNTGQTVHVVWSVGGTAYRASFNGTSWSGPYAIAYNCGEPNISTQASIKMQVLWRNTDMRLAGQRYSKPLQKVSVNTAESSPFNIADSLSQVVPYRLIRHSVTDLPTAIGQKSSNTKLKGTLAFELAEVASGESTSGDIRTSCNQPSVSSRKLSSTPFRVTSDMEKLTVKGAVYGLGIGIDDSVLSTLKEPLARVLLRSADDNRIVKELWRISPEALFTLRDSAFGEYREIQTALSSLSGENVFVDVEMLGEGRGVKPIIVDDYLLSPNGKDEPLQRVTSEKTMGRPTSYALYQNYPNPFNPVTTVNFDIPETGEVSLKIYNVLGEEILTIIDRVMQAGHHSRMVDFSNFPSGIYLARMKTGKFTDTMKLLLLK